MTDDIDLLTFPVSNDAYKVIDGYRYQFTELSLAPDYFCATYWPWLLYVRHGGMNDNQPQRNSLNVVPCVTRPVQGPAP